MKFISVIAPLLIFTACKNVMPSKGDQDPSSSDQSADSPIGVSIFPSKDALPKCTKSLERSLVYVQDKKLFYACKKGKWNEMPVSGEKGDTGDPGKRGPSGVVESTVPGIWRDVWKNSVTSVVYIESKFEGGSCTLYESGTGFVVGNDLVATNGHVVPKTADSTCGAINLVRVRIWFPTDEKGDTGHATRGSDGFVAKVDRSVSTTDDTVLLDVPTGSHAALTLSSFEEAPDHLSGNGVKLSDDILLVGYSGATTFAHFSTGRVNAIQATSASFLDSLVSSGLIAYGKIVYQYDLVSGGGASGSPLFSLNGEVIGINFAGNSPSADTDYGYGVQIKALRNLLAAPRQWENP